MLKKIIILVVLAGAGYVGYLVWNNLNESERDKVKTKIDNLAKDAADKLTPLAKEGIDKIDVKEKEQNENDEASDE